MIKEKQIYVLKQQPECHHTPCPTNYLAWHEWAEKKSKTHRQQRCPICGLYAVWVPKLTRE